MQRFDLVVLSHLRWDFVWQRPQQILSRLAKNRRILYVEEPTLAESGQVPNLQVIDSNLAILKPSISAESCAGRPLSLWPNEAAITQQIRQALKQLDYRDYGLWFYTPAPNYLVHTLDPQIVVKDVMDELSNFKFAPPELRDRERTLLTNASIVFTGGYSLYEAKKGFNTNTHLFASGVDADHYRSANSESTTIPDWVDALPRPRAAYIGVIDERLDYDLISSVASSLPAVQFLMCGPVVKVDPETLPRGANLHYPGQQQYSDLPRILKGTDVCLMPFARNEATRFISPTKTLEYMAARRPIVSTPISDVERFYSDVVYLADEPFAFCEHIVSALRESSEVKARKERRIESILAEHAWDAIADSMSDLIERTSLPSRRKHAGVRAAPAIQQPLARAAAQQ